MSDTPTLSDAAQVATGMAAVVAENATRNNLTFTEAREGFVQAVVKLICAFAQLDPTIKWRLINELKKTKAGS